MMILQHVLVVVAQSFRVFHCNQELVVNTPIQQKIRTLNKKLTGVRHRRACMLENLP